MITQKEKHLEQSIENHLVSIGYEKGHSQEFDLESYLFVDDLFRFHILITCKSDNYLSARVIEKNN